MLSSGRYGQPWSDYKTLKNRLIGHKSTKPLIIHGGRRWKTVVGGGRRW